MTEPISNTVVFGTTFALIIMWIGAWQWLKWLAKGKINSEGNEK